MAADALAQQLKLVRDSTCLFRQSVAYSARSEQTHQRWVDGALDSADHYHTQWLSASAYAKNYAHAFPSDCPAAFNGSDDRAPGKLANRLETLASRLSRADRHALAPYLSADALAKSTGEAAVAHTAGDCAACNLLRRMLPPQLCCAGLPRARQGPPAGGELGSVREKDGGSIRSVRVQKCPVAGSRSAPIVYCRVIVTYIYKRTTRNAKERLICPNLCISGDAPPAAAAPSGREARDDTERPPPPPGAAGGAVLSMMFDENRGGEQGGGADARRPPGDESSAVRQQRQKTTHAATPSPTDDRIAATLARNLQQGLYQPPPQSKCHNSIRGK